MGVDKCRFTAACGLWSENTEAGRESSLSDPGELVAGPQCGEDVSLVGINDVARNIGVAEINEKLVWRFRWAYKQSW